MDLSATEALRGYAQGRPVTAAQPGSSGASFSATMAELAGQFSETMQTADAASIAAMTGSGSGHALVTALAQSQLALETAVAVRNKVVEAYQDLLRMPV